jgi:RNase P subunit RPR2
MKLDETKAKEVVEASAKRVEMKVNAEMIRNSKNLTCIGCGGMLFEEKMFFKVLSPLISPSGKEELHMVPVIACSKCGKVSDIFDPQKVVPDELKAFNPKE